MKTIKLVVTSAILIFVGCNSKKDYPADVSQNILTSCQGESATTEKQAVCSCLLGKIQIKYSLAEFVTINQNISTGQAPESWTKFQGAAIEECFKSVAP